MLSDMLEETIVKLEDQLPGVAALRRALAQEQAATPPPDFDELPEYRD